MSPRFIGDPRFELKRSEIQVQLRMDADSSDADTKVFVAQFSEEVPKEIIERAEHESGEPRLRILPKGDSVVITLETKDPVVAAERINEFMDKLDQTYSRSLRSLEDFAQAFESEFQRIQEGD
jgi:hypothetical protein